MARRDTPAAGGSASITTTPEALVISRTFDAPRELVFQAWIQAESRKQWYGPQGFTTSVFTIDPRVGGAFHCCMRSPDGRDYWTKGVFREIVPPERIVYVEFMSDEHGNQVDPAQHGWEGFPRETLVTVTFEARGGRTAVTLRHEIPASAPGRDGAAQGWSQTLERLADFLHNKGG